MTTINDFKLFDTAHAAFSYRNPRGVQWYAAISRDRLQITSEDVDWEVQSIHIYRNEGMLVESPDGFYCGNWELDRDEYVWLKGLLHVAKIVRKERRAA